MKKLLILLFSLFFLSSPSVFAEDISDFQIEGMSIGDSLLDYMTEDKILEKIENSQRYYFLSEPNKFAEIYFMKEFSLYDNISVFIKTIFEEQYVGNTNEKYIIPAIRESIPKNNTINEYLTNKNEKYTILGIRGMIHYVEDFDGCIQKRDEIVEVFSEMFPNTKKEEHKLIHAGDPSGDSITDGVYFYFDSGAAIYTVCMDYEETFRIEKKWTDTLNVVIQNEEIVSWLKD